MRICYLTPDGNLSIVVPAAKSDIEKVTGPLTQQQFEHHVWSRSVPETAISPQWISDAEIPDDRYFRNAWKFNNNKIEIDLTKAYEIKKEKIRELRDPLLAKADVEYLKAQETNDTKTMKEIVDKKQKLRDATIIPNNLTVEQLKNYTPDVLKTI
jgi:hypothetical protein